MSDNEEITNILIKQWNDLNGYVDEFQIADAIWHINVESSFGGFK